ncbi:uncharacterized protein LOC123426961 [Hordeum vulgare subsp. vulgare]|uniref:uncharacterized protein LOC123426961 n=1 Tax=Hordeum vulgare subsp. vulgare TaxID=112509 RepID=UPI00029554FC|nr:uncharacterized protein LOC123426961 [Hordeum vulgare subsp. vulgare]XP_044966818.1 uncharacterized protein LOC123426961 [Hordeum vulgare subsp. vulgare]XP_044966819.1 uncharacterized protein LOC123426961 [Hordeum vulgare subsp. vulgare]
MKIDNERPYHTNAFHELVPSGGPKVDGEPERETKGNLLEDKMVEQTNPSEHGFVKAEHEKGGKTRQIRIDDVSYDKDVVEINLPDAVDSSDYGGHFVKDVCIDEGVLADQKASAEKVVSEKVCPIFNSSMVDANGDLKEGTRVDPVKTAHKSQIVPLHAACATDGTMEEIRADPLETEHESESQIVILHVPCATDGNTMEQYSCGEERDLEGNKTTDEFTDVNDEKLSPRQSSSQEAATQCQQVGTVISETCETHKPFCDGEAIDEVASNDCHETGSSTTPESSYLSGLPAESTSDGLSAAIPEEDVGAELDNRGFNPANHYNPFIAYGSLEDTWESKYALPTIVDDVSVVPVCSVGKTDSFSDLVNGGALGGFDYVETAESRIGDSSRLDSVGACSSRLGVQSSEESHDQRGSLVERTDSFSDIVNGAPGGFDSIAADETRFKHTRLDSIEESSGRLDAQASEESNDQRGTVGAEPSDVNSEGHPKFETDAVQDEHDFNPRDMEDGTKTREENNAGDQSSTVAPQTEPAVQQNGPDGAKLTTRGGIRNPFESSFSGANITLDAVAPSAHIGNISLRSDSSTTSTRSFAFPVLQTEWNSSPVRMAKADRRRFRRDRGWGYRVLCCKF